MQDDEIEMGGFNQGKSDITTPLLVNRNRYDNTKDLFETPSQKQNHATVPREDEDENENEESKDQNKNIFQKVKKELKKVKKHSLFWFGLWIGLWIGLGHWIGLWIGLGLWFCLLYFRLFFVPWFHDWLQICRNVQMSTMEGGKLPPLARVKALDFGGVDCSLLVIGYYTGHVGVLDGKTQLTAELRICEGSNRISRGVRAVRFLPNHHGQFIAGCDDGKLYLVTYKISNGSAAITMNVSHSVQAHDDFIRSIDVKGSKILSGADDMLIKLWDSCDLSAPLQTFDGHTDYVMQVKFHPYEENIFASGSQDKSINVWEMSAKHKEVEVTATPIHKISFCGGKVRPKHLAHPKTYHVRGVNCIDFLGQSGEYLISGSDDCTVKLSAWKTGSSIASEVYYDSGLDWENRHNVNAICALPNSNSFIAATEDESGRNRFALFHLEAGEVTVSPYIVAHEEGVCYCPPSCRTGRAWAIAIANPCKKTTPLEDEQRIKVAFGVDEGIIQTFVRVDPSGKVEV